MFKVKLYIDALKKKNKININDFKTLRKITFYEKELANKVKKKK